MGVRHNYIGSSLNFSLVFYAFAQFGRRLIAVSQLMGDEADLQGEAGLLVR